MLVAVFVAACMPALAQPPAVKARPPDCQAPRDRERWNDRVSGRGERARAPKDCPPKSHVTRAGDPNPYATRAGDPNRYATKAGAPNPYATRAGDPNPYATRAGTPKR